MISDVVETKGESHCMAVRIADCPKQMVQRQKTQFPNVVIVRSMMATYMAANHNDREVASSRLSRHRVDKTADLWWAVLVKNGMHKGGNFKHNSIGDVKSAERADRSAGVMWNWGQQQQILFARNINTI